MEVLWESSAADEMAGCTTKDPSSWLAGAAMVNGGWWKGSNYSRRGAVAVVEHRHNGSVSHYSFFIIHHSSHQAPKGIDWNHRVPDIGTQNVEGLLLSIDPGKRKKEKGRHRKSRKSRKTRENEKSHPALVVRVTTLTYYSLSPW